MKDDIPNTKEIVLYLRCKKCLQERKTSNIEIGWTVLGLQVWCREHDINIVHVDFEGVKHKANTTKR